MSGRCAWRSAPGGRGLRYGACLSAGRRHASGSPCGRGASGRCGSRARVADGPVLDRLWDVGGEVRRPSRCHVGERQQYDTHDGAYQDGDYEHRALDAGPATATPIVKDKTAWIQRARPVHVQHGLPPLPMD